MNDILSKEEFLKSCTEHPERTIVGEPLTLDEFMDLIEKMRDLDKLSNSNGNS